MTNRIMSGKHIIAYFCIFILAITVIIMSWTASYSIYNTDDFSLAREYIDSTIDTPNHIYKSLQMTIDDWFSWGGTYFELFLCWCFNPLLGDGVLQLKVIMTVTMLLLGLSIIFFEFNYYKRNGLDLCENLVLTTCFVWSFFNYKTFPEVFFWFTGAMDYSISLSLLLISYTLIETGFNTKKKRYFYAGSIILFFAAGGSQAIAFAAIILLFLLFIQHYFDKKQYRSFSSILIVTIPFFNILAPGNFVRHSLLGETHLVRSFFYACRIIVIESERLFKDTGFLIVLLVGGIFVFFADKVVKIKKHDIFTWFLVSLGVSYLACLGYNSPFLPNRILFVIDFFVIMGYLGLAINLGIFFRAYGNKHIFDNQLKTRTAIMVLVISILLPFRIEDGYIYKLGKGLYTGEILEYHKNVCDIFENMENTDSEVIYIDDLPYPIDGFVELWVAEDENDYKYLGNIEMGAYYGKDIVLVDSVKQDE